MHSIHSLRHRFTSLLAGLLIVVIAATGLGPAHSAQPDQGDVSTLDLVLTTIIPPRDRVDLARRLRGVTSVPAPPTSAPELQIGALQTFSAHNLDQDFSFQVQAELVYKTEHIYMFVEVGQPVDLAAIKTSAEQLEYVIRPTIHQVFGSEWLPGIDGDPHLVVLNASNLGAGTAGYYDSSSQYPVEAVPDSNEREMFFLNYDNMQWYVGTDYYAGVLAHEFQHMVHWRLDENETSWINEGMSELAILLTGTGGNERADQFLANPIIQLTTWPEDGNRRLHYGAAFLFAAYFYQRFGSTATTTLVRDPANGMVSVANTLRAIEATDPLTNSPVDAVDLFADWTAANRLQDVTLADGRYGYTQADLGALDHAKTIGSVDVRAPWAGDVAQWGTHYLRLPSDAQQVRLQFTGQDTVNLVPAQAHSGRYMWWSNRADSSDTRLTRTFDLTGVDRATLSYWAWYHIEQGWDYAYLMVSTDGGATWTPLPTEHTTDYDPHGQAYGPGYSGHSGGWVQETVDLSAYAGQTIQLRFESITDDAVNQPGLLIDDVSLPEIGYVEDFELGNEGWTAEGWLRMDNVLPQRFLVQVIDPGQPDAPVTRLLDEDDLPEGEWTLALSGSDWAVLSISGLAPVTTEAGSYRVRVSVP